jgi:hypothetical protein
VSRETGEVRSRVVPDVKGHNLRRVLDEHVDAALTHLHTDSAGAYILGSAADVAEYGSETTVLQAEHGVMRRRGVYLGR